LFALVTLADHFILYICIYDRHRTNCVIWCSKLINSWCIPGHSNDGNKDRITLKIKSGWLQFKNFI
jgi:hypothetical protein